jgi:hypothetical protein
MSRKINDSDTKNPSVNEEINAVIDVEQLQALTNKHLDEMVKKVSTMFPMRGLNEFLRFQSNEFALNLFQAILTVMEKKAEGKVEERDENAQVYQEFKKQLKHTLSKIIENIEKWGTPSKEGENGEEASIDTAAPASQIAAEKAIVGGVKVEQEQSFNLKEKNKDSVMKEEIQKVIKYLGEQREKYTPFIYDSGEEELVYLRGQVEGLTRIIDRIKPLAETDPRYRAIFFIGNKGETTAEELGGDLGLAEAKLKSLIKELKKLEIIDLNENGAIILKPIKREEQTQKEL